MAGKKQHTAKDVDSYIAGLPPIERAALTKLRATIRAAAPDAEEVISYQIPLYKHHGHLVGFAAFKHHCSLFVTNSDVQRVFAKELRRYEIAHTSIHFDPAKPLPASLVKRIVKMRVAENKARAKAPGKSAKAKKGEDGDPFASLSAPARRALAGAGIKRLEQLGKWSEDELLELHGMGPKAMETLQGEMRKRAIRFARA